MKTIHIITIFIYNSIHLLLFSNLYATESIDHVVLQLKWRHQFQFAGYYSAKEKGYYQEKNLDVEIREAIPGVDPVQEVLEGRAMFGVASSELALARAKGQPIIILGVIFQHSPLAIFARKSSGISSIHDLIGQKVVLSLQESEILAYFQREQLPIEKIQLLPHLFSVDDLLKGKVDAIAGYTTDEPYFLRNNVNNYISFLPRTSGIDFYGDTFFTIEENILENPELVKDFREATISGWKYALSHREETAIMIHEKYAPDLSINKLLFEANEMNKLIIPDLIELGYTHNGRWNHILEVYKELKMVPTNANLKGFLYSNEPESIPIWFLWVVIGGGIVIAIISFIASRYYRVANNLSERIAEIESLHLQLREQAIRDSLTGLFNRRYLDEALSEKIKVANSKKESFSVAMIDIDNFKRLNDDYGHAVGDQVLRLLGSILLNNTNPGDIACRYGGEEFLIVISNIEGEEILKQLEKWRNLFAKEVAALISSLHSTLSIGLARYPNYNNLTILLEAADKALYTAKREGRNRVIVV